MKPVSLEQFIKKTKQNTVDWCGFQDGSCPCSIIDTSESLKHQPNINTTTFFSSFPPSPLSFWLPLCHRQINTALRVAPVRYEQRWVVSLTSSSTVLVSGWTRTEHPYSGSRTSFSLVAALREEEKNAGPAPPLSSLLSLVLFTDCSVGLTTACIIQSTWRRRDNHPPQRGLKSDTRQGSEDKSGNIVEFLTRKCSAN